MRVGYGRGRSGGSWSGGRGGDGSRVHGPEGDQANSSWTDPASSVDAQTLVKTLSSLVLSTWSVKIPDANVLSIRNSLFGD